MTLVTQGNKHEVELAEGKLEGLYASRNVQVQGAKEDLDDLARLTELSVIENFVEAEVNPGESDITDFIAKLRKDGYILDDRTLRKLIRDTKNRTLNVPPVYDLEYDIVLQVGNEVKTSTKIGNFFHKQVFKRWQNHQKKWQPRWLPT